MNFENCSINNQAHHFQLVDVLQKLGYKYDASYTYTRQPESGKNAWPFTADYGWPYNCNIPPCPYYSHKGFWFIPVNSMWDYNKTKTASDKTSVLELVGILLTP
jgi:hypothetical protein